MENQLCTKEEFSKKSISEILYNYDKINPKYKCPCCTEGKMYEDFRYQLYCDPPIDCIDYKCDKCNHVDTFSFHQYSGIVRESNISLVNYSNMGNDKYV